MSQPPKYPGWEFVKHIPVLGHIKAGIHMMCGDKEMGEESLEKANEAAVVGAAAAIGGIFGGLTGAVRAATGAKADLTLASQTEGKEVEGMARIFVHPEDPASWSGGALAAYEDITVGRNGGPSTEVDKRGRDAAAEFRNGI